MSVIAFDTLRFVETLTSAGVSDKQAKAEASAIAEIFSNVEGATKRDLKELEVLLRRDMSEMKVDLLKWIIGLILGQTALLLTVLPKLMHA